MVTAARNADIERGAQVARALGWPADRVGFAGALGGLIDIGAPMRRPKPLAALLLRHRVKQLHDLETRMLAEQRRYAAEFGHVRDTRPRRGAARTAEALTPSERHVAALAERGLTQREIAQALFISTKTVEFHLRNAYFKLRISSRDELRRALKADAEAKGGAEPARAPHSQH